MKTIIYLSLFVVNIAAFPQSQQQIIEGINQQNDRIVTGSIVRVIEELKQSIKDAGLDPFHVEKKSFTYALPVPSLFHAQGEIIELLFTGLSNILIQNINYSVITSRLTFDFRVPMIEMKVKKASSDITVFSNRVESFVSGRLAVVGIRLTGNIRVSIGAISGISIRSIDMDLAFAAIESQLCVRTYGKDLSEPINRFLGYTIPKTLKEHSSDINLLLEIIVKHLVEG